MNLRVVLICVLATALMPIVAARAQLIRDDLPEAAQGAEVIERLGEKIPLDISLTDSSGETVEIGTYFDGRKPVIMALVYYDCPLICTLVVQKLEQALDKVDHTVGEDFRVVVASFDETNTAEMAAQARDGFLTGYDRPLTPEQQLGAAFHTGDALSVRKLADAVGFKFNYLPDIDEYAHPTCIFVLSPEGMVSRYIYGLDYNPSQIKLALLEASEGKTARSLGDRVLLFCYRYDPNAGSYVLVAKQIMKIGGAICVVVLGGLLAALFITDRVRRKARPAPAERSGDSPDEHPRQSATIETPKSEALA